MLNERTETVFQETNSRLHLAVFGKHPCWNDHMEDFGLKTPSLVELKRRLYYEGISGGIDSGAWRNLAPAHRIEAFDHELLWTGPTGVIFAVLWHSADAGGRAAYPMVAAAHFLTPRLPAMVGPVFEALQEVARDCREASEREAVADARTRGIDRLIEAARSLVPMSAQSWDRTNRENFILHGGFGGDREGFARLFYALTEYQNLHPAARNTFCYRVADGGAGTESLNLWQTLLRSLLETGHPLLTCRCRSQNWVDLMAGDFPAVEFSRLKAGPGEFPLVTDVPYTVPDELRERTGMVLESFLSSPDSILKLGDCGCEIAGQTTLGALFGRFFRSNPSKS